MFKFFAFLNRMKYIKRWSLMRSTVNENIMEHSQQVASIAHALAVIGNKRFGKQYDAAQIALIAQFHEAGEVITGDLPTPIKYFNAEIKTAYKELEGIALDRLLRMLPEDFKEEYDPLLKPDLDSEEYRLVKAADKISAYLKCIEELTAGNSEFKKAKETISKELAASPFREVAFFMENFAPAFELTLDELD